MARILCAYSGIEFQCQFLPLSLSSREVQHPIFHIPTKKLLSLGSSWTRGELPPTESYLTYLALLHSTGLIEWRVPARYTEKTNQIIANNMEQLLHVIGRIDVIRHPSFILPHFAISYDTASLENSYHWIQIWQKNYEDWTQNIKDHANDQELIRRELSLQRLLKSAHRKIEDSPKRLASWARIAGDFPEFKVRILGVQKTLADYWEEIIVKCAKQEQIFMIPEADLQELIDHCEDHIVMDGSIFAMALMRFLRKGLAMQKSYLGLDTVYDRRATNYSILPPEQTAERANIQNMVDSAPATEPVRKNYPDLISFIKAKSRWITAQAMKQQISLQAELDAENPELKSQKPEEPDTGEIA
jgi:hypothetical protein